MFQRRLLSSILKRNMELKLIFNNHRERTTFNSYGFSSSTITKRSCFYNHRLIPQGFNWEAHKHDWWRVLEWKIPDIAKSGFTSVWLPPATQSFAPEGYLRQNLYSLDSAYCSEHRLRALLQKMKQHRVRAMADIVINHRVGTTKGHGGMFNLYNGYPLAWDEHAVTSCTGGLVGIIIT